MKLTRTVTSPRPVEEVYDYLLDFTTTEEWEPATVRTTRVAGGGGVGTTYLNVTRFLGRETELLYEVTEATAPHQLSLRGENRTVVARDTMSLRPTSTGGCEVTYVARFEFKGLARLAAPLLAPALKRLGDNARTGMQQSLA